MPYIKVKKKATLAWSPLRIRSAFSNCNISMLRRNRWSIGQLFMLQVVTQVPQHRLMCHWTRGTLGGLWRENRQIWPLKSTLVWSAASGADQGHYSLQRPHFLTPLVTQFRLCFCPTPPLWEYDAVVLINLSPDFNNLSHFVFLMYVGCAKQWLILVILVLFNFARLDKASPSTFRWSHHPA